MLCAWLRSEATGGTLCCPGPGHELVEARGWPEIDELGEHVGEIGLRIDAVQFAGLDEGGDRCPVLRPLIVACEERVFSIEHNGTHASLDDVGVELDATVFEEAGKPVPMVQSVADGFGDEGLRRDARELLFEPGFESQHQRLALFLAHGTALVGRSAADGLLDRIEKSDAIEGFACDGCRAALGDVEELSSQMGPAEGERDGFAEIFCVGNVLVGGVAASAPSMNECRAKQEGPPRGGFLRNSI